MLHPITPLHLSDGDVIQRHADFPSQHVAARHVDVWLPPGYTEGAVRYPVLYMHAGQNLFDAAKGFGGEHRGIREAITRLLEQENDIFMSLKEAENFDDIRKHR